MAKKAKHYTLRPRKNCRRWELIIRDGSGMGDWIYAGLYKELDDAFESLRNNWGLEPSEEDIHTSAIIKANRSELQRKASSLDTNRKS